jgi:hypothetical protein
LWEAVAGCRLWAKRPEKEIMASVLRGEIPQLSSRVDVDPRLESIVTRATALDPDQRYASAEEMRLELEELLHTTAPVSSRDIGEFLSAAFAEARAQRHAEVAQLVAALPGSSEPSDDVATEFQVSVTKSAASESSRARPWRIWAGAAAALCLLVVLTLAGPSLWRGFERGDQRQAPSAALSQPVAARVELALSVAVVPKAARVVIDDGPGSIGGEVLRAAPNSEHVVRAELEGYSPTERRVTLLSDTSMTIELTALPASSSEVSPGHAPDRLRKSSASAGSSPRVNAGAPVKTGVGGADCSPPYYFVGGIKTFKPECI